MLGAPWVPLIQQNLNGGGLPPAPTPRSLPLLATLQMGNAIAGSGRLLPSFFARTNLTLVCTFFDPITLVEADPDVGTVVASGIAPDGSSLSLAVTRLAVGTYVSVPLLSQVGNYQVQFSGSRSGQVSIIDGAFVTVAPLAGASTPTSADTWVFVTASMSPYQAVPTAPNIAVDLRQGVVLVQLWPSPSDGDELTIKDWYDLSSQGSTGRGQPGGPILTQTAGGITHEDASNPGTYVANGHIAAPGGFGGTWKYSLQANSWTLKNQG